MPEVELTEQMVDVRVWSMVEQLAGAVNIGGRHGSVEYVPTPWKAPRAEVLAADLEAIAKARKVIGVMAEISRIWEQSATAALLAELGDGEAVAAPSGRLAYRGAGRDGRAAVRPDAFTEVDPETLPPHLRPRKVTRDVLPGVTELRKAAGSGEITWETFRELVSEGPRVPLLRWRTLGDDPEPADA